MREISGLSRPCLDIKPLLGIWESVCEVTDQIIIVGTGGHDHSVAEIIICTSIDNQTVTGFIDGLWPTKKFIWGIPILGDTSSLAKYLSLAPNAIFAIGNNKLRESLTIIHPHAIVSPSAKVGVGSTIMARAIIDAESQNQVMVFCKFRYGWRFPSRCWCMVTCG